MGLPPLGKNADIRFNQAFDFADQAVTTPILSTPARASANPILTDPHLVVGFERLDWCVQRIGHMRMNAGCSRFSARRARATGDSLVVREVTVAKAVESANGEVGHRARTGGGDGVGRRFPEGTKDHIGDSLRSLDITAG